MTTDDMRIKLCKYCIETNCKDCRIGKDCLVWDTKKSKVVRRMFHKVFPDYFKTKNEHDKMESISIWIAGNTVFAWRYTTGKKGVAKCSPNDKFDLHTGIDLAVRRMLGEKI